MKCLLLLLPLLFILACEDAAEDAPDASPTALEDDTPERRNLHEHDFHKDSELRASLGDLVVLHLEREGTHEGDSGGEGIDHIPYTFHRDVQHTVCFSGEEEDGHHAILRDETGDEVLAVKAGGCTTVTLPAGKYLKEVHHGDSSDDASHRVVFVQSGLSRRHFEHHPVEETPDPATRFKELREIMAERYPTVKPLRQTPGVCAASENRPANALNLKTGEVAVFLANTGSGTGATPCKPASGTIKVYKGGCDQVGAQLAGVSVGPRTQVVVFDTGNYSGRLQSYRSESVNDAATFCFSADHITSAQPSLAVSTIRTTDEVTCKVERSGHYCICGYGPCYLGCRVQEANNETVWGNHTDIFVPGTTVVTNPGEVLLIGNELDAHCCASAHVLKESCADLSLIAWDEKATGLVLGSANTFAIAYDDARFRGARHTQVDAAGWVPGHWDPVTNAYVLLSKNPADTINVEAGKVSSISVYTTEHYSQVTTIDTHACSNCNLRGVDFSNKNLNNVILFNADLTGADLTNTQLEGADLRHAILKGVKASNANFNGALLDYATIGLTDDEARTMAPANFSGAFMKNARLYNVNARGVNFQNAHFYDDGSLSATLAKAQLDKADFSGAVLVGTTFDEVTSMSGAKFNNAVLINAFFKKVQLGDNNGNNQVSFTGAQLYGTNFSNTSLDFSDLTNAKVAFFANTAMVTKITRFDSVNRRYVTMGEAVSYNANYPSLLPLTTGNTTCPDGGRGICDGNGGERYASCPQDCTQNLSCTRHQNCISKTWTDSYYVGRWQCNSGLCSMCKTGNQSYNCQCGDTICNIELGESPLTCPDDCAGSHFQYDFDECGHPSHCVTKPWPSSLSGKYGRWTCPMDGAGYGTCTAVESNSCGDDLCDMNGRWMPKDVPAYVGYRVSTGQTLGGCGCD